MVMMILRITFRHLDFPTSTLVFLSFGRTCIVVFHPEDNLPTVQEPRSRGEDFVCENYPSCVSRLCMSQLLIYNCIIVPWPLDLLLAMFNCRGIFNVRKVHTCPPSLFPLSEKARRSIHSSRIGKWVGITSFMIS